MRSGLAQLGQRDTEKNELQPHLKKTWCIGIINAAFIAQMERLLWLYSLPWDARFPVVCFDERPCFLIGDTVAALACSAPPAGHARWSLRLLADRAVELQLCEAVSHNAVKEILKKTN